MDEKQNERKNNSQKQQKKSVRESNKKDEIKSEKIDTESNEKTENESKSEKINTESNEKTENESKSEKINTESNVKQKSKSKVEDLEQKPKAKKSIKKFFLIILSILVIIVLLISGLFFILGHGNKDFKNLNFIFDKDKLIPVKVDGLYGYISPKNGKMVIDPQFKYANSFYGNFASVSYEENDSTKYGIIDKTGKIKLSTDSSYNIKILSEYGLVIFNDTLYNKNLKPLTDQNTKVIYQNLGYSSYIKHDKDGKNTECGILNPKGKKIYSYKFQNEESYFSCSIGDISEALQENYAVININNDKYAIINISNGKIIYNYTDKYITAYDDNVFKIYNESNSYLESTVCIYKNKIAYETPNDVDITFYDYDKKIIQIEDSTMNSSSQYSYYDLIKQSYLNEKPELSNHDVFGSLTGYFSFKQNGKYGIINKDKQILPCEYDSIEFLPISTFNYLKEKKHIEYAIVEKNNEFLLINLKNSNVIETFNTSSITTYRTSTFIKGKLTDSGETLIYNLLSGKSIKFDKSSTVSIYSNYITVYKDGDLTYYNTDLEEIYKI